MTSDGWYRATILLGRAALRTLGVTVRVSGAGHVPTSGPALLASAHTSYPDFVFLAKAALERGRRPRLMCRHDVWHVPVVRHAMDRMRHIPVDREVPAAAYLTARRLLGEGEVVGAFPEAGISYSFAVRSLMRGVAALGRETGVPVVPTVVWGGQRIWSVGRPVDGRRPRPDLTRGRLVDVRFGEPFTVDPADDLVEVTRHLGHALTDLLEAVQLLPEHRPAPDEHAPWYPAHLGGHAPDRDEAGTFDSVPRSAVVPTWGPPPVVSEVG
ncbi:MAG: lysophospholipid acyltransferase family protein [Nocardioides sp.]